MNEGKATNPSEKIIMLLGALTVASTSLLWQGPWTALALSQPLALGRPITRSSTVIAQEDLSKPKPKYLSEGSFWPGSQSTVSEHMTESVITLSPTATVKEAAILMNERRITGAPVVDEDRRLLGVISKSDLLRAIAAGPARDNVSGGEAAAGLLLDLELSEVASLMTPDPMTIDPDATVLEAAQLMVPKRINRLMVVDSEGLLVSPRSQMPWRIAPWGDAAARSVRGWARAPPDCANACSRHPSCHHCRRASLRLLTLCASPSVTRLAKWITAMTMIRGQPCGLGLVERRSLVLCVIVVYRAHARRCVRTCRPDVPLIRSRCDGPGPRSRCDDI